MSAALAGGLWVVLAVLFAVPPARLPLPECAFHAITGHSCLTCGMTRSIHAAIHGELKAAVRYHPFGPAVFAGMILCAVLYGQQAVWGRRIALQVKREIRYRTMALFAAAWLLYWGIRLCIEFGIV